MHDTLALCVGDSFNLEKAVCNHGFFMMAPNRWIPSQKALIRPLRLTDDDDATSITVSITQSPHIKNFIQIKLHDHHHQIELSSSDKDSILGQVARMLRISEKDERIMEEFQSAHPEAMEKGFGRIFRSPTLFEDIVKSVLLCYAPWKRSLEMAQALCDLQFKSNWLNGKRKRKQSSNKNCCKECDEWSIKNDNFPSPKQLANILNEETLNKKCNLGFRAFILLYLARSIENGTIKIADFEAEDDEKKLFHKLCKIKNFGPFTVANIMMCIGFYKRIPVDTETIKHIHKVHGVESKKVEKKRQREAVIAEIYDKYGPFQCLAYWMEHVEYYEKIVGKLSELPYSQYSSVSTPK